MPTKLNGYTLTDDTINQMRIANSKSAQISSEFGFALCADQKGDLHARNVCIGKSCHVEIEKKCKTEETFAGSYHTHPNAPSTASANDLTKCGTSHNICIGGADNKTICNIWRHEPMSIDKYNEFINLLNKGIEQIDDPIHEKNFECIKGFGQPAYIERMMPEIDKTIDEHQQELQMAKQEKLPENKIKEMEKIIKINLDYRSRIVSETLERIAELTPKYYKEKILE